MDATGHSTDFVVDSSFPAAMGRFVRCRHRSRPGLFLYGEPLTADALADWSLPAADEDGYSGIVTFSAGQEMEDFSAEGAPTVEGTSLLLSEYFAVSVVTPEDPTSDPFSAGVLGDLAEAFGFSARS